MMYSLANKGFWVAFTNLNLLYKDDFMQAIRAVYDGITFTPKQPIPVKGNYEVVITFLEPVETKENVAVRPPFEYESMSGKLWMADDFDAPLEDFKEYME